MDALDLLHDHGQRPRNMGRMSDAHAVGNVGSIVSGRALRWFLTLEGDRVASARFQVFAANDQVPVASVLSELVVGTSITDCLALGHQDVVAALGGLDPVHLPPQMWAVEALRDALDRMAGGQGLMGELDRPGPGTPLVCRCHGVDEATIKELARSGAADAAAVAEASPAGTGCGTCRRDIARLIAEVAEAPPPAPSQPAAVGAKGRIALMRRIQEALQPVLAEAAEAGCLAELWDLDGQRVLLKASTNDETLRDRLQDRSERRLKDEVDPLLTVDFSR